MSIYSQNLKNNSQPSEQTSTLKKESEAWKILDSGKDAVVKEAIPPNPKDKPFHYAEMKKPNVNCALVYRRNKNGQIEVLLYQKPQIYWNQEEKCNKKKYSISTISARSARNADTKQEIIANLKAVDINVDKSAIKYVKPSIGSTQCNDLLNCAIVDATGIDVPVENGIFIPAQQYLEAVYDPNYLKSGSALACAEILQTQVLDKDPNYHQELGTSKYNIAQPEEKINSKLVTQSAKNNWVTLNETPDGKQFFERKSKHSTSVVLFRMNDKGEREYLVRMQGQNLYDAPDIQTEFYQEFPDTVTGSLEYDKKESNTPKKNALAEAWEEAGFKDITDKNIVANNSYCPSEDSNEVVHQYVIDVTGLKQHKPIGDGSVMEKMQHNVWISESEMQALFWAKELDVQKAVTQNKKPTTIALSSGLNLTKYKSKEKLTEKNINEEFRRNKVNANFGDIISYKSTGSKKEEQYMIMKSWGKDKVLAKNIKTNKLFSFNKKTINELTKKAKPIKQSMNLR